jgi:hypothetical protein
MRSLIRKNISTSQPVAQCCAKTSQNVAGCHD